MAGNGWRWLKFDFEANILIMYTIGFQFSCCTQKSKERKVLTDFLDFCSEMADKSRKWLEMAEND